MLRIILAVLAVFGLAATAHAQPARLETIELSSKLVPSPVKVSVLLPSGYDTSKGLPLLLMLHGGGGDNAQDAGCAAPRG